MRTNRTVHSMEAGVTYSIREIGEDGTVTPRFTMRTLSPDPSNILSNWVVREIGSGAEKEVDVGEAWLLLCQASDAGNISIVSTHCAWCFPNNPFLHEGNSHGICDGCQQTLLEGVNPNQRKA